MKNLIKNSSVSVFLYFSFYVIIALSLSRIALALWQFDRVDGTSGWVTVLLQGMRVDLATVSMLLFIPLVYSSLVSVNQIKIPLGNRITQIWLTLIACCFVFLELATPSFIQEYNIRPNRLFIEYLIYPKEVFGMLIKSKLPELINSTILTSLVGYLTWKWYDHRYKNTVDLPMKWRPILAVFMLLLAILGGRSTLGHRPLNPSMVYFSNDPMVNSLTLNSFYSVLWSARQLLKEESSNSLYGEMDENKIYDLVKQFKGGSPEDFLLPEIPTYTKQPSSYKGKPKNLVIILEESLGARFVGSLGGLPLTPYIDQLSKESLFFTRAFATGTRSVRGIEAITTGFLPTPDRAVVKLDKSQKNFFSIAELLKRQNYHTEFIYGGEAHFDNMKSFFLGNGFDYITEQKDYKNPKFMGSWGVSDEDLFNKANERFESLSKQNKQFFSLVFSSTNHDPFEYPAGRIEQYDQEEYTRNNAIKYSDWALGQFIKQAKQSSYWKNTVFLIIADHDARSQGVDLVPIKSFHIPALILADGLMPYKEERIVSQIDMPPTLLSLIGIDNNSPMLGTDLTQITEEYQGRALLQNGQHFGFLTENEISILQPHKPDLSLSVNWQDFSLNLPRKTKKQREMIAKALALWPKQAYDKQEYKLPKLNMNENL